MGNAMGDGEQHLPRPFMMVAVALKMLYGQDMDSSLLQSLQQSTHSVAQEAS